MSSVPPSVLNTSINPLVRAPFYEADAISAVVKIYHADTHAHPNFLYLVSNFEVSTNCHGASDTATFTLPISINPDFTHIFSALKSDVDNATDTPIYVQIYAGYPATSYNNITHPSLDGLVIRFFGLLDQYTAVFESDTVTFQCRSLASPLTTERIQGTFGGQSITTVQFIAAMAKKYNLASNVFPGIKALTMQQVLANELQAGVHTYPIWDLILRCAVQDDVDVWVDAYGVLWYYPSDQIPRNKISLAWGRDIQNLSMTHGLQFMKNVEVRVHSYIAKTKTASSAKSSSIDGVTIQTQATSRVVTSTPIWGTTSAISTSLNTATGVTTTTRSMTAGGATENTLSAPGNYSGKQVYERWLRNATNQQCADYAKKFYRQILLHEYQVSMRVPVTRANLSHKNPFGKSPAMVSKMGIQAAIHLTGAPYDAINTVLWPRQIREVFDPESGWGWEIDANVNSPAQGGV